MGGIVAYLILAIPIFSGVYSDYTPGDLAQLISNYSFQSQYLIYLFTQLYDTFSQLSVVAGNCHRYGELIDKMHLITLMIPQNDSMTKRSRKWPNNVIEPSSSEPSNSDTSFDDKYLTIRNVTIRVPQSDRILIKDLNMEFKKGSVFQIYDIRLLYIMKLKKIKVFVIPHQILLPSQQYIL